MRFMIPGSFTDTLLLFGSTMRLTRLVTTDDLGVWMVHTPAFGWAQYDGESVPVGWRERLVSGLDCPWCVGFHVAWLGTAIMLATRQQPILHRLWQFAAGTLTLNYAATVVAARAES